MSAAAGLLGRDPAAFARVKALLIERTGHAYYADKDRQLQEIIARRLAEAGIGGWADYLARLEGADAAAEAEWRVLESAITINETFFFRFADQFTALREKILPDLIRRHGGRRRLRIWSAGCSTGAEPYSVAVLLHDLLGPALGSWSIAITGTDIDEAALAVARSGEFGSWALRTTDEAERVRLFTGQGNRWRLRPEFRGMVRFERLNLLDLIGEAAPLGYTDFDLILCRNVLIYFSQDVAGALAGALAGRLAECGVLLLGHAESGPAIDARVAPVTIGGVTAYVRPGDPRLPPTGSRPREESGEPAPAPPPPPPARRARTARPRPEPVEAVAAPPPDGTSHDAIRAALDAGELARAESLAVSMVDRDPADSGARYLGALAAMAGGDHPRAAAMLDRVLYLDPGFAMAHYLLGLARLETGDRDGGGRALRNALRSLSAMDEDTALREGDGMTARDLVLSIDARLRREGG